MKKQLFVIMILGLAFSACTPRLTPTLDMGQIMTIAAQTAVVQATQISFETQVAQKTQSLPPTQPATQPPLLATNTPVVITVAAPTSVPPTAVPTYTSTPVASATPTAVPATPVPTLVPRPGGAYTAAWLNSAPVLDGVWDEWTTTKFPITAVTWNRTSTSWSGAADLEGSFRIGYDASYLYVAVKVLDDIYAQNADGEDIFQGDSIEILLDTNLTGDYYYNVLSPDDYQLGISPGKRNPDGEKEAYLWFPQSVAGTRTQVKIAAVRSDDSWRVEAAIPWSVFGVTPTSGSQFGFALSISDCDDGDGESQDTMVSTAPGRALTNPLTWGTLTLQ